MIAGTVYDAVDSPSFGAVNELRVVTSEGDPELYPCVVRLSQEIENGICEG